MNSRQRVEYCGDLALLLRHGVPLAAAVDLVAGEAGAGSPEALIAAMVKSGRRRASI
ncbi:MAG: hypothetical protein MUE60_12115 [Candidatus Eisenbacteria bacterium]|nr:hypothetical protein [Candidatus Eisenbacteria bacterium]